MGNSARSPAPPISGCPGATAEGRYSRAGSDTAPAHTPALTQPAKEPSTGWDSASRSRPHLRISTYTLTRVRQSPLQSWQRLPIEVLEPQLRGCPQTRS